MSEKEYKAKCENMFARNTVLINENTELKKENERQKLQIEQLFNDNHVLKIAFITQQEQIEKMKPYCKELCKNYIKTEFMGNDCYNGVCRNCDKWEWKNE